MLYLKDKPTKLYRGDCKPMRLYYGDKLITGYEYAEQTGEHLSVENSVNDTACLKTFDDTQGEGDIISSGKNLFDKDKALAGYALYSGDAVNSSALRFVTDFIPVIPGGTFYISHYAASNNMYMCEYDGNFNMIKQTVAAKGALTMTSQTKWFRTCAMLTNIDIFQITLGDTETAYTPFKGISIIPIPAPQTWTTVKTFYPYTQIYTTSETQPMLDVKIRVLGG